MLIYNVTLSLDADICSEWLEWMKTDHIPKVIATGMFLDYKILKLLNEAEDAGGITYAVQYTCESLHFFNRYMAEFAPTLQQEHHKRYEGRYAAFRTLLERVG